MFGNNESGNCGCDLEYVTEQKKIIHNIYSLLAALFLQNLILDGLKFPGDVEV
jgi:hypothetical protein